MSQHSDDWYAKMLTRSSRELLDDLMRMPDIQCSKALTYLLQVVRLQQAEIDQLRRKANDLWEEAFMKGDE